MWLATALLVGIMSPESVLDGEKPSSEVFREWFDAAVDDDLKIPVAIARKARSFRYVFIGGFRNERMSGYFAQNAATLRALGVPHRQIHVFNPSSSLSIEENAAEIRSSLLEIASKGPERLVIVGHSRGACEAMAFALGNASFVEDQVEALFLVQGPFGGSGVAEYVLGDGVRMDRRMPLRHRVFGYLLGRLARVSARKSGLEVVEEMTARGVPGFLGQDSGDARRCRPRGWTEDLLYPIVDPPVTAASRPPGDRLVPADLSWAGRWDCGSGGPVLTGDRDRDRDGRGRPLRADLWARCETQWRSETAQGLDRGHRHDGRPARKSIDRDRGSKLNPEPASTSLRSRPGHRPRGQGELRAPSSPQACASRQCAGSSPQTVESILKAIGPCSSSSRWT